MPDLGSSFTRLTTAHTVNNDQYQKLDEMHMHSDLAYPVLFLSGSLAVRKKIVSYRLTSYVACVFDYPVPLPIRIFLWKTDVCGKARSDCAAFYMHMPSVLLNWKGWGVRH